MRMLCAVLMFIVIAQVAAAGYTASEDVIFVTEDVNQKVYIDTSDLKRSRPDNGIEDIVFYSVGILKQEGQAAAYRAYRIQAASNLFQGICRIKNGTPVEIMPLSLSFFDAHNKEVHEVKFEIAGYQPLRQNNKLLCDAIWGYVNK